jgi:hypothetical protein
MKYFDDKKSKQKQVLLQTERKKPTRILLVTSIEEIFRLGD